MAKKGPKRAAAKRKAQQKRTDQKPRDLTDASDPSDSSSPTPTSTSPPPPPLPSPPAPVLTLPPAGEPRAVSERGHGVDNEREANLLKKLETLSDRLSELDKRARVGLGENRAVYRRDTLLFCRPIGFIKSAYPSKTGTPRQGSLCPDVRAELTIAKDVFTNADHSLEGLKDFTHVWLLFWFHLNGEASVKAKVKPPRLEGTASKGVFATRSPHRPNPIGLSLVRLDRIVDDTLHLTGVDLVDGTPVLDVKPFIDAYDTPIQTRHEIPNPSWVTQADQDAPGLNEIEFSSFALRKLKKFHKRCADGCDHCLRFIDDTLLYGAMRELLRSDLRSRYRRAKCSDRIQFVLVDNVKVSVWYDNEGNVHVLNVQPFKPDESSAERDADSNAEEAEENGVVSVPAAIDKAVNEVRWEPETGTKPKKTTKNVTTTAIDSQNEQLS